MTIPKARDVRLKYAVERGFISPEMRVSADFVALLISTRNRQAWSRRKLASLKAYVGPALWLCVEAAAVDGLLTAGITVGMDISKASTYCRGGLDLVAAWREDWIYWGLDQLERKYPDTVLQPVSHATSTL